MADSRGLPRRPSHRAWLLRYLDVQARYDVRLNRLLEQAAKDIEAEILSIAGKTGVGADVRRGQLIGSKGVIHRLLAEFWKQAGDLVRSGREAAIAEALEAGFDWDEPLLARIYPDPDDREQMRKYLVAAAERNVDAMLRRAFGSYTPLSRQVYRTKALSGGWVDRAVTSGLATGVSANELARRVRSMIDPRTPGGVTYAARRLARTEINNSFHAQTLLDNSEKPWNTGMRWRISKSHQIPDECDDYARQEHGMGPGVFPIGQVPSKPHPQCFCYVTAETISVAEFERAFDRGLFSEYLREKYNTEVA